MPIISSSLFCKAFGVAHPIVQAPMAGVSTISLAAAVTLAGAMGSIPVSHLNLHDGLDKLSNHVQEFRKQTQKKALNLNFFCHEIVPSPTSEQIANWHRLYRAVMGSSIDLSSASFENKNVSFLEYEGSIVDELVSLWHKEPDLSPSVVSFHFGVPSNNTIRKIQALGIRVFATATSVEEFELLQNVVDGVVCQGYQAGGHRGKFLPGPDKKLSTWDLFEAVKAKVSRDVFVIPTGGIMNAQDVRRYLTSGASAVQAGSVFLTSEECKTNQIVAENISKATPTMMIELVSGKPARAVQTPFLIALKEKSSDLQISAEKLPPYGPCYTAFKSTIPQTRASFPLAGLEYSRAPPASPARFTVHGLRGVTSP